ncbi:helix-turn-helix domain-containing protein [Curtobacterium sp. MCPF17_046]|uniref:helix-turn-helix domain-containing protein n=1 Tax=Curtobacterium sp. MCPF17_046 TaxID=2175663 RepID=UPI000D9D094A|nr:hypothetical protein DEJ32_14915 [Curtobacterium sp. MCPF17_046]
MRQDSSNTDTCKLLRLTRCSGTRIRQRAGYRIPSLTPTAPAAVGHYLEMRERLQIAELRRLGLSIRQISVRLGRYPSTISREFRRHRTGSGSYLPHLADDDAKRQCARPKPHSSTSGHSAEVPASTARTHRRARSHRRAQPEV